jgi:arylsulfatase A-like enzyme
MNILLLYADDWRYDTLGAAGNPIVKTPVLDKLATEGVRFSQNCVTTSICHVSRATLYSGQYLARHRFERMKYGRFIEANGTKVATGFAIPQNETIYSLLKQKAGYYVGHVGKFGLQLSLNRSLNFDFRIVDWGWHYRQFGNKTWHITEKNTADALRFLTERDRSKPFFLNVAYFATHAVDGNRRQYLPQSSSMSMYENDTIPIPLTATEEAWNKMPPFFGEDNKGRERWTWRFDTPEKHQSVMKNYYRMATEVDTSVGVILSHLEQEGQMDNTLIIFTSDNGNFHAEHGLADKWYPHQESIRVPLIIKDPRMSLKWKGTVNDDFTLNIDLAATILEAAGLEPLPSMMGRDMSVLYRERGSHTAATARRKEFVERQYPDPATDGVGIYHSGSDSTWRTEFFYEHPIHSDSIPASEALVRKDYKYFYWPHFKFEQLFDIKNDPGELIDLANSTNVSHKQKLGEMRKRFNELKIIVHSDAAVIV